MSAKDISKDPMAMESYILIMGTFWRESSRMVGARARPGGLRGMAAIMKGILGIMWLMGMVGILMPILINIRGSGRIICPMALGRLNTPMAVGITVSS